MSQRTPSPALSKTPMERIFEKVTNRKMTAEERAALQLDVSADQVGAKPSNGNGLIHKVAARAAM